MTESSGSSDEDSSRGRGGRVPGAEPSGVSEGKLIGGARMKDCVREKSRGS